MKANPTDLAVQNINVSLFSLILSNQIVTVNSSLLVIILVRVISQCIVLPPYLKWR